MPVDQVTSTAGGATGLPVGSLTGTLQGGLGNMMNMGKGILDRIIPPATREDMKQKLTKFATEKPYLASFLLSQIALSGLPLALFVIMTISVTLFALIVGLLVGLLGAVLFILGAVIFALIILLPVLFFTTFAAVAIWLWGMGAYSIVKAFNEKRVPGIHVPMGEGLKQVTGVGNLNPKLENQQQKPLSEHSEKSEVNGTAEKPRKRKSVNGHTKALGDTPTENVTSPVKGATSHVPGQPVQQIDKGLSGVTSSVGL